MGRQSSRIYYQGLDHKEMVTWDGTKYQYHDKAYIWNGSSFELVWEKLDDLYDLWFVKDGDLDFYHQPIIIRNNDDSVNYYIDYNGTELIKVYPDGTKEYIDVGRTASNSCWTKDGYIIILEKTNYTQSRITLVNMNNMSIVKTQSITHNNYRAPQYPAYLFSNIECLGEYSHNNDLFRKTAVVTIGSASGQTITYQHYICTLTIDTTVRNKTYDFLMSTASYFIDAGLTSTGSFYEYGGIGTFNEYCYRTFPSGGIGLGVFRTNFNEENPTAVFPAEYRYGYNLSSRVGYSCRKGAWIETTVNSDYDYDCNIIDISDYPFNIINSFSIIIPEHKKIAGGGIGYLDKTGNYLIVSAQEQESGYYKPANYRYDISRDKVQTIGAVNDRVYTASTTSNNVESKSEHIFVEDYNHVIAYSEKDGMYHKYRITSVKPNE